MFHFSIENDTELFYMVNKRDVPSFEHKTSLHRSTAMREIDGLILIFIDFYVSESTPRLN